MADLISLPYSPWSDKAKWALAVRGVDVRVRNYAPIVGEPRLRRLLGRWRGPVTVPVLVDGDTVLGDSLDIARWADARGDGPTLFPDNADVERYNALGERALACGRALSLPRVMRDPDATAELVPGGLRRRIGPLASPVGRLGVWRTWRKHGGHRQPEDAHRQAFREILLQLRADLAASPSTATPKTLFATFTYADIVMAEAIAYLVPPPQLRLGLHNRRNLGDAALAAEFPDLVAWRDAIFAAWR